MSTREHFASKYKSAKMTCALGSAGQKYVNLGQVIMKLMHLRDYYETPKKKDENIDGADRIRAGTTQMIIDFLTEKMAEGEAHRIVSNEKSVQDFQTALNELDNEDDHSEG